MQWLSFPYEMCIMRMCSMFVLFTSSSSLTTKYVKLHEWKKRRRKKSIDCMVKLHYKLFVRAEIAFKFVVNKCELCLCICLYLFVCLCIIFRTRVSIICSVVCTKLRRVNNFHWRIVESEKASCADYHIEHVQNHWPYMFRSLHSLWRADLSMEIQTVWRVCIEFIATIQ